jgi:hypothetical protein
MKGEKLFNFILLEEKNTVKVNPDAIPSHIKKVIEKIVKVASRYGYKVYASGGFVRDIIMGRPSEDLDVVVVKKKKRDSEQLLTLRNLLRRSIILPAMLILKGLEWQE